MKAIRKIRWHRVWFSYKANVLWLAAALIFSVACGLDPDEDMPSWSPNGDRIAFVSDGEIHVINANGSNQSRLTKTSKSKTPGSYPMNDCPQWSPDGTLIAFNYREILYSGGDALGSIFVMESDGSQKMRLAGVEGLRSCPVWSPDSKRVAFIEPRRDHSSPLTRYLGSDVFVIHADSSNLIRLTEELVEAPYPHCLAWSVDGEQIALAAPARRSLYLMNSDGSQKAHLAVSPLSFIPTRAQQDCIWPPSGDGVSSPDGTRVAFFVINRDGPQEISVMNADGSAQVRVSVPEPSSGLDDLTWSPDGKKLAYTRFTDCCPMSSSVIDIVDLERGSVKRLTDQTGK
jgi:Tol biopolymer transport system component